jgi:hypothetical protein
MFAISSVSLVSSSLVSNTIRPLGARSHQLFSYEEAPQSKRDEIETMVRCHLRPLMQLSPHKAVLEAQAFDMSHPKGFSLTAIVVAGLGAGCGGPEGTKYVSFASTSDIFCPGGVPIPQRQITHDEVIASHVSSHSPGEVKEIVKGEFGTGKTAAGSTTGKSSDIDHNGRYELKNASPDGYRFTDNAAHREVSGLAHSLWKILLQGDRSVSFAVANYSVGELVNLTPLHKQRHLRFKFTAANPFTRVCAVLGRNNGFDPHIPANIVHNSLERGGHTLPINEIEHRQEIGLDCSFRADFFTEGRPVLSFNQGQWSGGDKEAILRAEEGWKSQIPALMHTPISYPFIEDCLLQIDPQYRLKAQSSMQKGLPDMYGSGPKTISELLDIKAYTPPKPDFRPGGLNWLIGKTFSPILQPLNYYLGGWFKPNKPLIPSYSTDCPVVA